MMLKFTCLVLSAVSLINIYVANAEAPDGVFKDVTEVCSNLYNGPTRAEMIAAMQSGNLSGINPCFWGCYFRKIGILNDKGQYDLNTGLAFYRKVFMDDAAYARIELIAQQCETVKDAAVKDGDDGCERGVLVVKCFTEKAKAQKQK